MEATLLFVVKIVKALIAVEAELGVGRNEGLPLSDGMGNNL